MLSLLNHCDEVSLVFSSVLVVTVNKYVLSTLHFTLPTVFQGWQTLVCVAILTILLRWSYFRLDITTIDRKNLLRATVPILSFTMSGVAGSKALAELPVAVFAAGTNSVPALLALLQTRQKEAFGHQQAGSAVLLAVTGLLFMLSTRTMGWFWLCLHCLSLTLHHLTITPLRLNAITWVYHCNFCSAAILLPLSVYMQEAHSAVAHARNAKIEFYFGCVLSGILGTVVQLELCRLHSKPHLPFYQGMVKILSCTLSLIWFSNDISMLSWMLIVVNLVIGCFLFIPEEDSSLNDAFIV